MGEVELMSIPIHLLDDVYAIVQLDPNAPIPVWAMVGKIWAIVRTEEELSIVCREDQVPAGSRSEKGWRIFKVVGPLDFSLVGVLAGLTQVLASAEISIFSISTFDTDYILVKDRQVQDGLKALDQAGYPLIDQ